MTLHVPAEFKYNGSEVLRAEVKGVELKENRGRGRAAGIGNMDRGGDVIAPGAFKSVGKEFKKSGEILIGHDWGGGSGVATVEGCGEEDDAYLIEFEFYSTPDAQQCRQKLIERTERGKTTGMSIGFMVDPAEVMYFESGEELSAYCRKEGIKVDHASCKCWKTWCRLILKIKELFETSLVTVPMNPRAYATAVKDFFGGDGSHAGLTLEDQMDTSLAVVAGAVERLRGYKASRDADNRLVSPERLAQAESLLKRFEDLLSEMQEPQAKHAAGPDMEFMKLQAQRLAIA